MVEAAKAVDDGENHTNEIQQRRKIFLTKFGRSGLLPGVIFALSLANNAKYMTGVEPDKIHYAIMSNISFAELCEVWFFSKKDDEAFNTMCTTGDLNTLREFVSRVPAQMHVATEIVNSSEEFRILQQILCDREPEGYSPDTSRRDIVNFGSMLKLLDPDPTCILTEEHVAKELGKLKTLGETFRCRLREFAFPSSVHADLDDRYDGDLDDVRVDYNAMRSALSGKMLNEDDFDEKVKMALWRIREQI